MLNYIEKFIKDNNITKQKQDKYAHVFNRVENSLKLCEGCKGLYTCRQKSIGERLSLINDDVIYEGIELCSYKKADKELENIKDAYVYSDIPDQFYGLSLDNIEIPDDKIRNYMAKCLAIYQEKADKGLYVYGDLGVGKTYMLMALANSLVKKGKKVAFIKISSFINEMRKLVGDFSGEYESIINGLKTCDYLFIDDIGAETVTSFSRDDVLFVILDYRMEHNLITCFSSNYDKKGLQDFYTLEKSGKVSEMQARRLLERIDILTQTFALLGNNKRR